MESFAKVLGIALMSLGLLMGLMALLILVVAGWEAAVFAALVSIAIIGLGISSRRWKAGSH